ncbi:hypothetical protein H650_00225 (plasmid) [Enterobacter sp. R4-368]|nr:hypothetical protein H650_00225 [Enterobacter sp. R4-368]
MADPTQQFILDRMKMGFRFWISGWDTVPIDEAKK